MTREASPYPQPQADGDNAEMLKGWRDGRLLLRSCGGCGLAFFYPRPLCPYCWSTDLAWKPTAGTGTVVSFSCIHRPNHPSFLDEVPIVLAEIRLTEGLPLLARIVGGDAGAVHSGMAVSLVPLPEAGRYPLPTFCPSTG